MKYEISMLILKGLNQMLKVFKKWTMCWRNRQYSRREGVKVIGTHNSIVHSELEKTVWKVLQHFCEEKIKLCHHLNKKTYLMIVVLFRRKDCEQVMRVKKGWNYLNQADMDFREGSLLFINDSLCPCYRGLIEEKAMDQ